MRVGVSTQPVPDGYIYMEEAATARRARVSRGKLITFCKGDQSLYFQYRIHWLQATYVPQFLSLSYV